ncbi:MAG: hypothetical protein IPP41_15400 [Rhodocyclaceae bacterium]|nr:hypothetical protein [Rhodocyclaceae bacterium]
MRDSLRWSGYRDALVRFGDAEVFFASHLWPMWGQRQHHAIYEAAARCL